MSVACPFDSLLYFLRVPKGVAGVCHCSDKLEERMAVTRAAPEVSAASAALAQPLVKMVAVLAKVFDPRATVVGDGSTPTGASLIKLPFRLAAKQPNSTPSVVLEKL